MARRKFGNKNNDKTRCYCWDSNHQYRCYRSLTNCSIIIIYKEDLLVSSNDLCGSKWFIRGQEWDIQKWRHQNHSIQFLVSKDRTMTPMRKKKCTHSSRVHPNAWVEELMLALAQRKGGFFLCTADNKPLRLSRSRAKVLSPKWTGTLEQTQGGKVWLWKRSRDLQLWSLLSGQGMISRGWIIPSCPP